MSTNNITVDYYGLLGLEPEASDRQIASAYRSMALKLHPDKNPVDPVAAAAKFLQIKEAYQILSDPEAKAAYDKVVAARRAHRQRELMMDGRRREMRQDLLHREAEAEAARRRRAEEEEEAEMLLARQMERLRRQAQSRSKDPTILRITSLDKNPLIISPNPKTGLLGDADLSRRFADALGIPAEQVEYVKLSANKTFAKVAISDENLCRSIIAGERLPVASNWIIEADSSNIKTDLSQADKPKTPVRPSNYEEETLQRLLAIAKKRNKQQ